jgi:hypothetical protein
MEEVAGAIFDDADEAGTRPPRDTSQMPGASAFPRSAHACRGVTPWTTEPSTSFPGRWPAAYRLARLGAGGLGAALFGTIGNAPARTAAPAAQAATCQLDLVANVRLGASAGTPISGSVPGELRAQLSFGLDDGGAISDGRMRLADGQELPVVGQALGRALHLRVQMGARQPLILVGTAEQDLGSCQGSVDGLLTGPQPGGLGDWHATATSLGQRGAASGATSGGSSGSGVASVTGSGTAATSQGHRQLTGMYLSMARH